LELKKNGKEIFTVENCKYFCIIIDAGLSWKDYKIIVYIYEKNL